ncbi:hypothetical protein M406DRAFT_57077, partial [Cryphonectria parasitica EP155]
MSGWATREGRHTPSDSEHRGTYQGQGRVPWSRDLGRSEEYLFPTTSSQAWTHCQSFLLEGLADYQIFSALLVLGFSGACCGWSTSQVFTFRDGKRQAYGSCWTFIGYI